MLFALISQGSKLPELGNRQQATGNSQEKTLAVFQIAGVGNRQQATGNSEEKTLIVFFLTFRGDFHKNRARFLETEIALFLFKRIQFLGIELNNRRHFDIIIG
ncbi:MAG TPA: hypothetical protein V6D21_01035 [Candidatus Obscuribacterales bacterium]